MTGKILAFAFLVIAAALILVIAAALIFAAVREIWAA